MIPQKLKKGDEIRVIAPSRSLAIIYKDVYEKALDYLTKAGYKVTFSKNAWELDEFSKSSSIKSRVEDLNTAFADKNVKAILTCIGGFNVNQILSHIDYNLIKSNPKIICGYSDITALLTAIHTNTGLITYHGPHFSTFGFETRREYTAKNFSLCVESTELFSVTPSENHNYAVVQSGTCEGELIGGNLCTLNLLQGTEFMPNLENKILFLEDDNLVGKYFPMEFDRNLQSLLHCKGADKIKGIIFGKFQESSNIDKTSIKEIIKDKINSNIPVVFNVDFGHVLPITTLPIGGMAKLSAKENYMNLEIVKH